MVLAPAVARAVTPTADELGDARRWAAASLIGNGPSAAEPPFSFTLDGKPSADFLRHWKRSRAARKLDDVRTEHTLTLTQPDGGLVVRCVGIEYADFPAVEWILHFQNNGPAASPILENIQALDGRWQRSGEGEFLLHHAIGSPATKSDYGPRETPLPPGASKRIAAAGGRPTNSDLSYFNLEWPGQGVILAVGWPGQWAAEFTRDQAAGIRIRAGQELTHFKLLPGEEVRTPLVALLFWRGDWIRAQNLWRQWMIVHNLPRQGGKLPPPQFVASSSRAYGEMIGANEQNQIMHIDRYVEERLKLDYWWMDAGWYVQQQGWPQVGTWEVDPKRFPHGLRPISDHAHAQGIKTLVWFEPERVTPGTWLYENHPEWLLTAAPHTGGLRSWSAKEFGSDPNVTCNQTAQAHSLSNIVWEPGRLSLHPGPQGQYSVIRFTAPEAGEYAVDAAFLAIDQSTTTDVHLLDGGHSVLDGFINLHGQGKRTAYIGKLNLAKEATLDFAVGWGNGSYICDSTGLEARLTAPSGKVFDPAKEFSPGRNPNGPWSYGYLKAGPKPDGATLRLYDHASASGENETRLLNLGDPAARQWLTDHVDRLLTDQGIDLYRQDFNMDPLAYWRANDAPDRQGITEIRHVCGYLAYWDELRRRHPQMLIDTCASGGRRNDLETLRRAVPLWRSDYAYEPIGHQCMTYGISFWIPYHGTGTVACANAAYYGGGLTPIEPYAFWSNTAPSLGCGIDIRVKQIDYNALRRLLAQWRQINPYYYDDYYPLTAYSQDDNAWIAWQFDRPETGEGMIQAFRRGNSSQDALRLRLRGLDPAARFVLINLDTPDKPTVLSGHELSDPGLPIHIADHPGAAVFTYRKRAH
jgi:alpha-galactosidase